MRAKTAGVAVLAIVLLGPAGCDSGGSAAPSPAVDEATGGDVGLDPDATAPAAHAEGAQEGGDITVQASTAPVRLDPTQAYEPDAVAILNLVTRALTQYAYDPETGQMLLVPDLATDLGRPNDDLTEWTFTLREGLRYADGSEISPDDVAYAINRSFANGPVPGGPDGEGVEVDGRELTISLRRPFGDLPYYASFPAFTAIPRGADTEVAASGPIPAATGPYQVESYRPDGLVLTRNEYWDPATDPARHQYADTWRFEFDVDADTIGDALIEDTDTAQTTATYTGIQTDTYALAAQDPELEQRLVTGTTGCTEMWHLDMRKITDRQVRRAVGHAYPYREVWRAENDIEGVTRIPATTILPPGTHGRVGYDPLGNGGAETDPQRARALLEEAGQLGFELRFFYETDNPASVSAKDVIRVALEQAGFRVTPIATTVAERGRLEHDPSAPVNIRRGQWCSDWPTGGSWFPAQWAGALTELADVRNLSFLDERDVDQRIEDISANLSGTEASRAWGELDEYIQRTHYPAVPIGYAGVAILHGSRIGGTRIDSASGMPQFTDMYVIPE